VSDCVVGLRGLELRANHAVAIEPISGRGHLADFLRSNVAELPKNPPENGQIPNTLIFQLERRFRLAPSALPADTLHAMTILQLLSSVKESFLGWNSNIYRR
jgi:hypothetical protein